MTLKSLAEIMDGIDPTMGRARNENPLRLHHVRRVLTRLQELGLVRLINLGHKEFIGADPHVSNEDFMTLIKKASMKVI